MKRHRLQKYIRSFGLTKPKQAAAHVLLELLVVAVLGLAATWAWQAGSHMMVAAAQNPEQRQALAIAGQQINALQSAGGIAAGDQCFDTHTVSRSSSEAGAPCSFDATGKKTGCITTTARCYRVTISAQATVAASQVESTLVGYQVVVSWNATGGKLRQVTLPYRVTQSNWSYSGERIGSGVQVVLPQSDGPVGGGTRIVAINKLEDIPGGAAVGVTTAPCAAKSCSGAGAYQLVGSYALTTNIPSKLITSCTWDFGDGSAEQDVSASGTGCVDGQVITHDYRSTWQLQNLPPYPSACIAPKGEALDSQVFYVTVTLHTTQGKDITLPEALRAIFPSC